MEILKESIILLFVSYVIWKVCDSFQIASIYLGRNMPNGTRGATLNAIGSSFPEFFTSLIAIFSYTQNDGAMFGIANTTGSVVYNISIIPFCVIMTCFVFRNIHKMFFNRFILLRDGLFLIITQVVLMKILSVGKITLLSSFILVLFYLIYLVMLFYYPEKQKTENIHKICANNQGTFLKKLLNLDLFAIFFPKYKTHTTFSAWTILCISIVFFYFTCDLLISSSYAIGDILKIPSYIIAMTVTAIATSVPDTILSIKDAKINKFDDAITNVFGSNIFNISFCIGFPVLIYNLITGKDILLGLSSVESINNLKNLSIIILVLVLVVFVMGGQKYWGYRSILLLLCYAVFIAFVIEDTKKISVYKKNIEVSVTQHHHR